MFKSVYLPLSLSFPFYNSMVLVVNTVMSTLYQCGFCRSTTDKVQIDFSLSLIFLTLGWFHKVWNGLLTTWWRRNLTTWRRRKIQMLLATNIFFSKKGRLSWKEPMLSALGRPRSSRIHRRLLLSKSKCCFSSFVIIVLWICLLYTSDAADE